MNFGYNNSHIKNVLCENSTSHNLSSALTIVFTRKTTPLCYLPPCTTHLIQLINQFLIVKIRDAWTYRWEQKKLELFATREWQNDPQVRERGCLGKLRNLGKYYLLGIGANVVCNINKKIDEQGMSYAKKTMIKCKLSLGGYHNFLITSS